MIISGIVYDSLIRWDNLWLAFRKAAKGKRGHAPAADFEHQVADRLVALQNELTHQTYIPGAYRHFYIHEPKQRKISAAPFRDRVVHHALCNVIEPVFDARFIADSYANRRCKGTHAAIDCLQLLARQYPFVLRLDIVKHFPSLDHAILMREMTRVVHDEKLLWLIGQILASGQQVLADEYQMVYFPGDDLFALISGPVYPPTSPPWCAPPRTVRCGISPQRKTTPNGDLNGFMASGHPPPRSITHSAPVGRLLS
jgi:hypothetical protein